MNLRKRQRGASAEVHTSAMNDIMFFLLLFFLIASTVTNPNVVKLMLPKSSSGQAVSKKTINVSIDKDLQYQVNKKPVTLDQLRPSLEAYKSMASELTIVLFVEHSVAIENVVQVMDIAKDLNIKMVLATQPKGN